MVRITKKILPRFLLISFLTVVLLIATIRVSFPRMLSGFLPDVSTASDAATKAAVSLREAEKATAAARDANKAQADAAALADRAAAHAAEVSAKAEADASSAKYLADQRKKGLSTSDILWIVGLLLFIVVLPVVFFVRKWRSERNLI